MTDDLLVQLRSYGDAFEATLPDTDLDLVIAADGIQASASSARRLPSDVAGDSLLLPRPETQVLAPVVVVRRRGVWAAAAAVVITLLIGGVAWLSQGSSDEVIDQPTVTTIPTQTSIPTPTTIAEPTTTPLVPTVPTPSPVVLRDLEGDQIPAGVVNQTLTDSLLGDIEWTVIDLAAASAPSGPYMTTPLGLAIIDNASGQLWLSDTGTDWRIVPWPVPGEVTRIESIDGGYLLESQDDWRWPTRQIWYPQVQLWESADFVTWTPYRFPDGVLPTVSGVGVTRWAERNQSVTAAGVSFTAWDRSFGIVWEEILVLVNGEVPEPAPGVPRLHHILKGRSVGGEIVEVSSYEDEGDAFFRFENGELLAQIELSVTGTSEDWVAELKDATTGEPVGSISGSLPGLSLDEIRSALIDGRRERVYVVGSGDDAQLVQPVWIVDAALASDGVVLAAIDDTLFAHIRIGNTGGNGPNQIWQSTDGRTWVYVGAAPWPNKAEISQDFHGCCPVARDGVGVLWLSEEISEFEGTAIILRSEDGVTWEPPSVPPTEIADSWRGGWFPVDSGWMSIASSLWVSSDGDVWEQVDTRGLPPVDPNRGWVAPPADSESGSFYWIYYPTEQGFVVGKIQR